MLASSILDHLLWAIGAAVVGLLVVLHAWKRGGRARRIRLACGWVLLVGGLFASIWIGGWMQVGWSQGAPATRAPPVENLMSPIAYDAGITFCNVPDLDAVTGFYESLLGLPLVLDQGGCRIYRVAGSGYLGFCERDVVPETETVLLTLVLDDVDGLHERLVAGGAVVDQAPRDNATYGIYHAFYRDPAGYRIEVQRFHDPHWAH